MKKKHLLTIVVAFALCVAMILPFVPVNAEAKEVNNFNVSNFEGLKFSLIGDSISTFEGVSNNTAYNATIGGNAVYYGGTSRDDWATNIEPLGVSREDTWWQQAIDTLGMELCVNNSWSGSKILNGTNANSGCVSRCQQLHNVAGEKPDVIAVFLGTNDCNQNTDVASLGTPGDAMYNKVIKEVNNASYEPSTILGAYSLMVYRAMTKYPDAELYCFTLQHKIYDGSDANRAVYDAFNAGVEQIVNHYASEGHKIYLVDLYDESGLHGEKLYQEYCLMTDPINSLHPNPYGMDSITNCLISSMMKNSQYMNGTTRYSVSYDLTNTYVEVGNVWDGREMYGDVTTAIAGKPFSVKLGTPGAADINVTVKMGGEDISEDVVHGDVIYIESVTGNIEITATEFDNFYWTAGTNGYLSNPNQDATFSYNKLTVSTGSYIANGKFNVLKAANAPSFKLEEPAMLNYARPWVMEFVIQGLDLDTSESANGGFQGGILLTSDSKASSANGNIYIHLNQSSFFVGYRDSAYNNSGYTWEEIATKLGSSSGESFRNEKHTYRLENKLNSDGTNTICFYVDNTSIGTMDKGTGVLSGRNIIINYFGSETHPLQATALTSMKIYENGIPTEKDPVNNFRWNGVGESLTTEEDGDFFTENVAELEMGSGVNGVHENGSYYSLDKPITLLHDRSWTVEFKAKGDWGAGDEQSPMIFSTYNGTPSDNPPYLWRNASNLIAFGYRDDGSGYLNYGVDMSAMDMTDNEFYVYRMENHIAYNADGTYKSNMVYLYVDDVQVGPMNQFHKGGESQGTTSDWISGKDFVFNYLGNYRYPLNSVTFDYIQVWENGGKVNTLRLEYLINNRLSNNSYNATAWTNYDNAVKAGQTLLGDATINQDKVDAAIAGIMDARNKLTKATAATTIHDVELVTGTYARVGMQTGLRVVTSPDVTALTVTDKTLIICSSQPQKLLIGGVETEVKVWLITFEGSTKAETVDYTISAKGSSTVNTTVSVAYSSFVNE